MSEQPSVDTESTRLDGPAPEPKSPPLGHWDDMTPRQRLQALTEAQYLIDYWRHRADATAERLRLDGVSWTDIGRAAGITSQSAHQRWSLEAKQKRTEQRRRRRSEQIASG